YAQTNLAEHWGLILGLDIGTEEKTMNGTGVNTWFAPVGILKYSLNDQWTIAGRYEYYADENGVIISSTQPGGFKTAGLSFNVDHKPSDNMLVRLELRHFQGKEPQFIKDNQAVKSETFLTASMAISF
ncbi:MAG: hypothetical protein B7Z54_07475, partial [Sphingobacteriales bacterium 12-47-4]